MKKLNIIALAVMVSAMLWSNVEARPKTGFGLFGGVASHSADGKFRFSPITKFSYSSSGLSIGIDYQFAIGENISFNPFLVSSFEDTRGDLVSGVAARHDILGIQMRFWVEDIFFGGHVGAYDEFLFGASVTNTSGTGAGFGIIAGLELDSGVIFSVQYDIFNVKYSDAKVDLTGVRIHAGFRWGGKGSSSR